MTGDEELVRSLARPDIAPPTRPGGALRPGFAALLAYAEQLTRAPASIRAAELEALRREGWEEEAILHACEIVAYYNFVNRLADGLRVRLEDDWPHPPIGEPPAAGATEGSDGREGSR